MSLRTSLVVGGLLATCTTALEDIPPLGLGTWLSDRNKVPHAVEFGLKNGYDHIDAAWIYRNEDQTGKGIAAAALPRDDIWVTSKLWNSHHRQAEAETAIRETLDRLGLDQLDLYLVHWPVAFVPDSGTDLDTETSLLDTWRTMEGFVRANLTRHIGVSNFARADVEAILAACDICPTLSTTTPTSVSRLSPTRPLATQTPSTTGARISTPFSRTPSGPSWPPTRASPPRRLCWLGGIQRGTIVIPKSTSDDHLAENVAARKVTFTKDEMEAIARQDKKARFSNPSKQWG
ncbi:hypothetical protein OPQ81_005039 [Rhizoctonia solani]|nr:hypothetical protein OPQ81_005039 [Rhizoctonia solani]